MISNLFLAWNLTVNYSKRTKILNTMDSSFFLVYIFSYVVIFEGESKFAVLTNRGQKFTEIQSNMCVKSRNFGEKSEHDGYSSNLFETLQKRW